jgi:hypothetical protein
MAACWFSTTILDAKTFGDFEESSAISYPSTLHRQSIFSHAKLHSSSRHYQFSCFNSPVLVSCSAIWPC